MLTSSYCGHLALRPLRRGTSKHNQVRWLRGTSNEAGVLEPLAPTSPAGNQKRFPDGPSSRRVKGILPRHTIKIFRCKQHDIVGANAHRRKRGHDHWMATQHRRRRWRRVLKHREREQETASDSSRRHRFLWHRLQGTRGDAKEQRMKGKAGLEDPIMVAMALLHCRPNKQHRVGKQHYQARTRSTRQHPPFSLRRKRADCSFGDTNRPDRHGTTSCARSPSADHRIGVSPESDDPTARSSGHSATVVQCDSRRGGRSHHSHEGLQDASDRNLSLQVRVQDENFREAVRMSLCATGARHMAGTAPPNHHERVLSQHVNQSQPKRNSHKLFSLAPRTFLTLQLVKRGTLPTLFLVSHWNVALLSWSRSDLAVRALDSCSLLALQLLKRGFKQN